MKKGKKKYSLGTGKVGVQVAQQIPQILETLFSSVGAQGKEPLVNPSVMRSMVSPYAFGGEVGDGTYTPEELESLQEEADMLGMSLEELLELMGDFSSADPEMSEEEPEEFADEEDEEYFSLDEEGEEEEEEEEEYAMGGTVPIEVEGEEVLETPAGEMVQAVGPSHEQGGIDTNVPQGTKIFSNRLAIEGKTMQERKLAREKRIKKSEKRTSKPYATSVDKATLKRVKELSEREEQQDMTLQKIADTIYSPPTEKKALGGVAGGVPSSMILPLLELLDNPIATLGEKTPTMNLSPQEQNNPLWDNFGVEQPTSSMLFPPSLPSKRAMRRASFNTIPAERTSTNPELIPQANPVGGPKSVDEPEVENPELVAGFTPGDYTGMIGNLIAGLGPLSATIKNAQNTKPNINRFLGYGKEALDTNESLQDAIARLRQSRRRDVNTSTNTAFARNRNSASSVNTMRALNTAAEMGRNKALQATEDATDSKMMQVLDRRSQLQNESELRERMGEQQRDDMDARDMDNVYSNLAANLANLGINLQGLGKNLNTNKSNQDSMKLLSQLSVNGITLDKDMSVVNKNLSMEEIQKYLDKGWTLTPDGKLRRPRVTRKK